MTQTDFMSNPDLCTSVVLQDLIQAAQQYMTAGKFYEKGEVAITEALSSGKLEFYFILDYLKIPLPEVFVIGLKQSWFHHCSLSEWNSGDLPVDWQEDVIINVPDERMREQVIQIIQKEDRGIDYERYEE